MTPTMTDLIRRTQCPYCGSHVDLHAPGPITGLWLDQPATFDGEPIIMGTEFPLWTKLYAAFFMGTVLFLVIPMIYFDTFGIPL